MLVSVWEVTYSSHNHLYEIICMITTPDLENSLVTQYYNHTIQCTYSFRVESDVMSWQIALIALTFPLIC